MEGSREAVIDVLDTVVALTARLRTLDRKRYRLGMWVICREAMRWYEPVVDDGYRTLGAVTFSHGLAIANGVHGESELSQMVELAYDWDQRRSDSDNGPGKLNLTIVLRDLCLDFAGVDSNRRASKRVLVPFMDFPGIGWVPTGTGIRDEKPKRLETDHPVAKVLHEVGNLIVGLETGEFDELSPSDVWRGVWPQSEPMGEVS